jgi:AAA-like domain
MTRRSLQLRPTHVKDAKAAFKQSKYKTQIGLAIEAEIQAQSTVSAFFCAKPIERANFHKLCELLALDPLVVGEEPLPDPPVNNNSISVAAPASTFCREGENIWYQQLLAPHALIRIQAPAQFGKTSLLWKLLDRAEQQGHLCLYLNLNSIEPTGFTDSKAFFRAFVCEIASEIAEKYVDCLMPLTRYDELAALLTHTKAFIKYLEHLQQKISQPLTIAINKLDRLLDFPAIADEFLFQLRNANEKSKKGGIWGDFRLVLAYSTPRIEEFVNIADNRSPFNVGYSIELEEFSPSEVTALAISKRLVLDAAQIEALMQSIGGIPSLIQLTLKSLAEDESLQCDLAATEPLYQEHLAVLKLWLQQRDLYDLMRQIATNPKTTTVSPKQRSLLHRQGLIISLDRQVRARCELYRRYFAWN